MSKITIVACGLSPATLTKAAADAIQEAELILGAQRLISLYGRPGVESYAAYIAEEVARIIRQTRKAKIVILVSGDSGFYSATRGILAELPSGTVDVLPGVSSLQYFFAKLQRPWQDVKLLSCHGCEHNLVSAVRRERETFVLTGANVPTLMQELSSFGFADCRVWVGENLGLKQEKIYQRTVGELLTADCPSLTVLLIENPAADRTIYSGLPDEQFVRGKVPLTKANVRAVILSKLQIAPDSYCLDLGAGSGSVAVEMALQAYEGRVLAVDHNPEAVALIKQNARRFQTGNIIVQEADILAALSSIQEVDRVFLGGGGAAIIPEALRLIWQNSPGARVVASAITLESVQALLRSYQDLGANFECTQLTVSSAKKVADVHMMIGENPIYLISGGL